MQKTSFPSFEAARVFSLQNMELLDTPAEEQFDRITRTAQRLFNVDICLISLVDSQRLWFKSAQGIEISEVPREKSFCSQTILSDEIMVVEDALDDPRFVDSPLVAEGLKIRFYAGVPIYSADEYAVGTLCLIHLQPRKLNDPDRASLKDLAGMVQDRLRPSAEETSDRLTQLVNRHGFELIAPRMLSVCSRTETAAQLLFFELDDFEEVNEQNTGNGDEMLLLFSKILKTCFHESDLIAHFGGGEFVVLTTGDEVDADRLRRLAKATTIVCVGRKAKLEWSVGITHIGSKHRELFDVLAEANTRMLEDKNSRLDDEISGTLASRII